jgi:hypothetical protein
MGLFGPSAQDKRNTEAALKVLEGLLDPGRSDLAPNVVVQFVAPTEGTVGHELGETRMDVYLGSQWAALLPLHDHRITPSPGASTEPGSVARNIATMTLLDACIFIRDRTYKVKSLEKDGVRMLNLTMGLGMEVGRLVAALPDITEARKNSEYVVNTVLPQRNADYKRLWDATTPERREALIDNLVMHFVTSDEDLDASERQIWNEFKLWLSTLGEPAQRELPALVSSTLDARKS